MSSPRPVMVPRETVEVQSEGTLPPNPQKTLLEESANMFAHDRINLVMTGGAVVLYSAVLIFITCSIHGWATTPHYSKLKASSSIGSQVAEMAKLCPDGKYEEFTGACDSLKEKIQSAQVQHSRLNVPGEQISQGPGQ